MATTMKEPPEYMDTYGLVAHQDDWWRTREGVWLQVNTMDPAHRINLAAWLSRVWDSVCYAAAYDCAKFAGTVNGDMALWSLERAMDEAFENVGKLEEQPLMQRLRFLDQPAPYLREWIGGDE